MRICSLLPSATDIVMALGLGDSLVAVTHECDLPPGAAPVPVITSSRLPRHLASREIHNHVTASAHSGSSLYTLDQSLLERLAPDVILTQELCDVCAISYGEVATAVHRLDVSAPGPRTMLSLEPQTLGAILDSIVAVGRVCGVADRAAALVAGLRSRIERIADRAATVTRRPRVFAMEWLDPPYSAGHWVPEMVQLCGGRDELGRSGGFSEEVSWRQIADWDPEVLILMPCSFTLERTLDEAAGLAAPDGWSALTAVRSGRVYAVDASRYFSRSGPAVVDGLEILAAIIHPALVADVSVPPSWRRVDVATVAREGR